MRLGLVAVAALLLAVSGYLAGRLGLELGEAYALTLPPVAAGALMARALGPRP